MRICGSVIMGICSTVLLVEHAPLLYHLYLGLALLFWTEIISDANILSNIWHAIRTSKILFFIRTFFAVGVSLLVLEMLVYFHPRIFCFILIPYISGKRLKYSWLFFFIPPFVISQFLVKQSHVLFDQFIHFFSKFSAVWAI